MSVTTNNTNASLSSKTITVNENADTITGLKTFDRDPSPPFAVTSGSASVANLDADMLDGAHYATNSWTPGLSSTGGGAVGGYLRQFGHYVKIGRMVNIHGRVTLTSKGTLGAGSLSITGLPFTTTNTGGEATGFMTVSFFGGMTTNTVTITFFVGSNGTTANIFNAAAAVATSAALTVADISATFDVAFGGWYLAAS